MAVSGKKHEKSGVMDRENGPVETGHDYRGKQRDEKKTDFNREPDAPDGISGDWN